MSEALALEAREALEAGPESGPESGPARRVHGRALLRGRGLVGLVLVGFVALLGVLAPLLAPYSPTHQIPGANLLGPSARHLFGTDDVNRDMLSRTLYGVRTDLLVVFVAVPVGAVVGTLLGLAGSWYAVSDTVLQRLFDVLLAFPPLILAIALAALLGPGLITVVVVIVSVEVPVFGRLVRTSMRTVREMPYVEAAQVVGAPAWWLLRRHVLPNSLEPLTIQLAVSMSVAVFVEGSMSFLGIGVRPPTPTLGSLIKDGVGSMYDAPLLAAGPLLLVVLLVLGLLLVAQALGEGRRG